MVSAGQIPQAINTIQEAMEILNNLRIFMQKVQVMAGKGWQIDVGPEGTPILVNVTSGQQASLLAQYDALKASLQTKFQALP